MLNESDQINYIENAWQNRHALHEQKTQEVIRDVIDKLDKGIVRVTEKKDDKWIVNEWIKKLLFYTFPFKKWKPLKPAPWSFMTK